MICDARLIHIFDENIFGITYLKVQAKQQR